jgi:RND family efflux transporter MFP subunit
VTTSPLTRPPNDPLASLRIDRNRARPSGGGWLGKLLALAVVAALAAGGSWAWNEYGGALSMPEVQTALVTVQAQGAEDSVLSAQGYLKSEKQAAIGAKVPGRVLKVYAREGQPVEADEVLAELEHADVDETLAAMQATLEAKGASLEAMRKMLTKAKADLVEVEATLEQDESEYTRSEQLFKSKIQTASEFERAEAKLKASRSRRNAMTAAVAVADSRLTEAEAHLRESQARLREADEQRQNLFVRAPFKGIVISKEAEEGESIMPGGMGAASGRGAVVTLADLLHLEVEADVKENYVSRVKKGQLASIAVDAVPNHRFGGRVRTIIPMGDRAKGTVKVKVRLNVDEVAKVNDPSAEDFTLFPEMGATVYFLGEGKAAASGAVVQQVFAPSAAVQTDASGSFVWQVVDDQVRRVAVETGETGEGRVLIRRGLKGGERVVVDPPQELREAMRVQVTP